MLPHNDPSSTSELLARLKNVKKITPKELSKYTGFEDVSADDAYNIIYTLETYCELVLKYVNKCP
jgi:hypothetical protein